MLQVIVMRFRQLCQAAACTARIDILAVVTAQPLRQSIDVRLPASAEIDAQCGATANYPRTIAVAAVARVDPARTVGAVTDEV